MPDGDVGFMICLGNNLKTSGFNRWDVHQSALLVVGQRAVKQILLQENPLPTYRILNYFFLHYHSYINQINVLATRKQNRATGKKRKENEW